MVSFKIFIKNMVCDRCKRVVAEELERIGYHVLNVKLGEAEISASSGELDTHKIKKIMTANGFELLDDPKAITTERIKLAIIDLIHYQAEADAHINTSDYLADKLGLDYHYISTLFSAVEGITIEKYLILQRIERVKELLVYNELSLKEIAFKLGYSSLAHLSSQFKKITGLAPSHFREIKEEKRKTIDKVY
jgi:AraC family transcriptional regulator